MPFEPTYNSAPGTAITGGSPDYATMLQQGFGGIGGAIQKNRDYAAGLAETQARLDISRNALDANAAARAQAQKNWEAEHQLAVTKEAWDEAHPTGAANPPFWLPDTSPGAQPGQLKPAPKGPYDPATIEEQAKARARTPGTKPLPFGVDKFLGTTGQDLKSINRQASTWKPEYGGHQIMGDFGNDLARHGLPTLGGSSPEQAQWWSDYYANTKAIKRNRLYGAALTPQEREDFDRSDINPTMTPEQIKTNLERQHDILYASAQKFAAGLIAGKTDPKQVEQFLGVNLDDLGIKIDRNTGEILELPNVPGLDPIGDTGDDVLHL